MVKKLTAATHGRRARNEILRGTLDMLILRTLSPAPAHGYTIAQSIERVSRGYFQMEQGSLYPALHRLEDREWIKSFRGTSENNRQARYYRLTPAGRDEFRHQLRRWKETPRAIGRILDPQ